MNHTNKHTLVDHGRSDLPLLILAHGAGAPMDSFFMSRLASGFSEQGIEVIRFEFTYMEKRRRDGKRRPPDRMPALIAHFKDIVAQVRARVGAGRPIYIGGKSMGSRVASHLSCDSATAAEVAGVICFGYPFHAPAKPDRWRTDHFHELLRPTLIVQGTRDPFGKYDEVISARDSAWPVELLWLPGGNHDYEPLKRQRETQCELLGTAISASVAFMMAGRGQLVAEMG